jgi:hypothetical protein
MPMDDTYLLFDKEDPNQIRKYQQYKKNKYKEYALLTCIGLLITIPVTCGLYSISTSLDKANIPGLTETVTQITNDFEYIKSINGDLKTLTKSIQQIQERYDVDEIDRLLIKMNIALDELIKLLELFPHPPYPPQSTNLNHINMSKTTKNESLIPVM